MFPEVRAAKIASWLGTVLPHMPVGLGRFDRIPCRTSRVVRPTSDRVGRGFRPMTRNHCCDVQCPDHGVCGTAQLRPRQRGPTSRTRAPRGQAAPVTEVAVDEGGVVGTSGLVAGRIESEQMASFVPLQRLPWQNHAAVLPPHRSWRTVEDSALPHRRPGVDGPGPRSSFTPAGAQILATRTKPLMNPGGRTPLPQECCHFCRQIDAWRSIRCPGCQPSQTVTLLAPGRARLPDETREPSLGVPSRRGATTSSGCASRSSSNRRTA